MWTNDQLKPVCFHLLIKIMIMPPLRIARAVVGQLSVFLVSRTAGVRKRIQRNLELALPELNTADRHRIENGVLRNLAWTFTELFYGRRFAAFVERLPLEGSGVEALQCAQAERRPVFLVTGHVGNYDAVRAALLARGFPVGGIYRPMNNRTFNEAYLRAISQIGQPLFAKNRNGLAKMVQFLRAGGMVGVVLDQYAHDGEPLNFFGHPARTSTAIAAMAIRYDALVIPRYGIRTEEGQFRLLFEDPIAHSDPITMTQELNNSLERVVRQFPEQWLWSHRRWKK